MVPEPLKVLVISRRSSAASTYWVLACTSFLLVLGNSTAAATAATHTTAVIFFQLCFKNCFGSFLPGCAGSLFFFRSIVSPLLYCVQRWYSPANIWKYTG